MSDEESKSITPSIEIGSEFAKPSERPVTGDKRMVRYLPFPIGNFMLPAIWISPYVVMDPDIGRAKVAILLLDKGPPKPDVVSVRIPEEAVEKFPYGPVEW